MGTKKGLDIKAIESMINEKEKEILDYHKGSEVGESLGLKDTSDINNDIDMSVWEDYCYMLGCLDTLNYMLYLLKKGGNDEKGS